MVGAESTRGRRPAAREVARAFLHPSRLSNALWRICRSDRTISRTLSTQKVSSIHHYDTWCTIRVKTMHN